jgi:hypothetical protein
MKNLIAKKDEGAKGIAFLREHRGKRVGDI